MGATQQLLLHQRDKLLLHSTHVLVAHLFQPGSDLTLKDGTLGELVPFDVELPKVHLVLGNLFLQVLDSLSPSLLLLHVHFFMLYLGEVELQVLFLFRLFVDLFIAFKELVLGKVLGLVRLFIFNDLWGFYQNVFNFFFTKYDIFLGHYFDLAGLRSCILFSQHLLFGKGWIFFHHNFIILLFFLFDLPSALLS
jgi:hypothetical protein